jgi:hypothetical protein
MLLYTVDDHCFCHCHFHCHFYHTTGNKILTVVYRDGTSSNLDMTHKHVEPLSYPLLFTHGENGWCDADKDSISFHRYLAMRMLMPERTDHGMEYGPGAYMKGVTDHGIYLNVNRFQVMSRLSQVYIDEPFTHTQIMTVYSHK